MTIRFGPAGLGSVKEAIKNLEEFNKLGIKACEIAFTYGVYIHNDKDAEAIKSAASRLGIRLSIHAPYWINLNSAEKKKIQESKKRILDCCKIGEKLGVEVVVFHAGFYGKRNKEESYENIKNSILEIQEEIKENKWKIKIAPETMGKVNVFGSMEDIANLVRDTGCSFCLDFAHIEARDKKVDWEKIEKLFGKYEEWHCHFSGIVYNEKGERHHIKTQKEKWKIVLENLPKNKDIVIINESPDPVEDSIEGLRISKL